MICPCGRDFEATPRRRTFCSLACSNRATAAAQKARAADDGKPRPIWWACGGGVDSTAIASLICRGALPAPKYAWIVDVGYEPDTTWDHVRAILQPNLAKVGVTLRVIRTADYLDAALVELGHCTLPAYRRLDDGRVARLDTHCSGRWKAQVARTWLRAQGATTVEQWVGIAADEARRVRPSTRAWIRHRYPLVDQEMTRADCVNEIARSGWPVPERTSCYLCPQRSSASWRRLAHVYPLEFGRACEAERQIQATCPDVYLHHKAQPLRVAVNGCEQGGGQQCTLDGLVACA